MRNEPQRDEEYLKVQDEGIESLEKGRPVSALTHFMGAFRLHPESPVALFNVGRVMDDLGDPEAEHFYTAAANRGSTDALYQLGTLYHRLGRTHEAVEPLRAFLKAVKDNPNEAAWAAHARKLISNITGLEVVWSRPQ